MARQNRLSRSLLFFALLFSTQHLFALIAPDLKSPHSPDQRIAALEQQVAVHQLFNQLVAVLIASVIAIVGTLVILKIVDVVIGLRVSREHEVQGLDLSQHDEEGYYWEVST